MCSIVFWSVKLLEGIPVKVQPLEGCVLNVQQAALSGEGVAVVKVQTFTSEGDKVDSVIATLRSVTADQVHLNLLFGYDVPVSFVVEGSATVHLCGYYQPGPTDEDGDYVEEDSEDSDEDSDDNYDSSDDNDDNEYDMIKATITMLGDVRAIENSDYVDQNLEEGSAEDPEPNTDKDNNSIVTYAAVKEFIAEFQSSKVEDNPFAESEEEEEEEEEGEVEEEEEAYKDISYSALKELIAEASVDVSGNAQAALDLSDNKGSPPVKEQKTNHEGTSASSGLNEREQQHINATHNSNQNVFETLEDSNEISEEERKKRRNKNKRRNKKRNKKQRKNPDQAVK